MSEDDPAADTPTVRAAGAADPAGGGSVRVVGTAHVSAESVDRVRDAVEADQPDVVAVELDEARYRRMKGGTPDDLDRTDLLRGGFALQLLAYWLLSYVQSRLGERFDVEPGADMEAAVEAAEASGASVALVDRDIQVTISRFLSRMTLREKLRLGWHLLLGLLGFGDAEEFDPEEMTDADVVTAIMEEFRQFSPGGAEALIDERDAYIAHHLHALRDQGYEVLAVVGAGHREGVESYLADPDSLPPLADLVGDDEDGFSWFRALGALLGLVFLVFFVLLALAAYGGESALGSGAFLRVFGAWVVFNGVLAGSFARVGGGRWPSVAAGGGIAWLSTLNPLFAPGWLAGYVELRYEDVNVSDIGRLNEILGDEGASIRELVGRMRAVPLFRLIAVVAMTNIGSTVATVLFPVVVLPFLGGPFDSVSEITVVLEDGFWTGVDVLTSLV
jgi:pheromone shutdown-related protein TraB